MNVLQMQTRQFTNTIANTSRNTKTNTKTNKVWGWGGQGRVNYRAVEKWSAIKLDRPVELSEQWMVSFTQSREDKEDTILCTFYSPLFLWLNIAIFHARFKLDLSCCKSEPSMWLVDRLRVVFPSSNTWCMGAVQPHWRILITEFKLLPRCQGNVVKQNLCWLFVIWSGPAWILDMMVWCYLLGKPNVHTYLEMLFSLHRKWVRVSLEMILWDKSLFAGHEYQTLQEVPVIHPNRNQSC